MIALEVHADGVMLPVRAHAGGRRNGIGGQQDGMLKVSVTQAAEKGKANRAILSVLCDELSLRKSQMELLAGDTSPQKRFLVRDLPIEDLRQRIDAALARFRPRRA